MSVDDRFRDVNWEDVLNRLTLRARHLYAGARARNFGDALVRTGVDPSELAHSVILAALEYKEVKYKSEKGASIVTFLLVVLERRFIDLLRQGIRLDRHLVALDTTIKHDPDTPSDPSVLRDAGDGGRNSRIIELRSAALKAAKGEKDLEDYVTAAFDCGASKRADQATLLGVSVSEVTNLRKKLLRRLSADGNETPGDPPGSDE